MFSELVRRIGFFVKEVVSVFDEFGCKGVVVKDEYCFMFWGVWG